MKDKINYIINFIKIFFINIYNKIKSFFTNIYDDFIMIDIEEGQMRYSFHWWIMKSFKWLIACLLAFITLFLWGCSSSMENIKYYPVNVPIKCPVENIPLPQYSNDILETNLNILHYTKILEETLKLCINGELDDRKSI